MPITIKNWKLALIALLFFCLFISLGNWQLKRAKEKRALLATYESRIKRAPQRITTLSTPSDLRFYQILLHGHFQNEKTILLDNKTYAGQIGYEIYTPFLAQELTKPILVDRGFISMGQTRQTLPIIRRNTGEITLTGMLNLPPKYVSLGGIAESTTLSWPLRVEYIHLDELKKYLGDLSDPYVLQINPNHVAAYPIKWEIVIMSPEKHLGYALQWFAFALTLLILFVALNRR
jgi:surfeit locus 1 family protein